MKSLRLVLPLVVSFFATAVCSTLGGVVGDPCAEEGNVSDCQTQVANENVTRDSISALTQTQSVLHITYPANPALQAATATLTKIPTVISTETLTLIPVPQAMLQSGTYQVAVLTGGKEYRSTWTLEIISEVINGNSEWDCCPGPRQDPLSGTIIGEQVTIERNCSGQGFTGPCSQTYSGRVKGNTIAGTITGTGIPASGATWTLYLSP